MQMTTTKLQMNKHQMFAESTHTHTHTHPSPKHSISARVNICGWWLVASGWRFLVVETC